MQGIIDHLWVWGLNQIKSCTIDCIVATESEKAEEHSVDRKTGQKIKTM